jgi:hypothetical protein
MVDAEANSSMTVTVDVGGYPTSCNTSASCSWIVCKIVPRKVDEYGDLTFTDERGRLDSFATELQNDPSSMGYIMAYAGRRARRGEAQRRGEQAKSYLVKEYGLEDARLVVVDGGHKEWRTVELFIVPSGATPPVASPTVDPKEVKFIVEKGRGRSAKP